MAIKAREVRERLKGRCDEQVMYVLESLAEQQSVHTQMISELAIQLDRMANILSDFTTIAANMKDVIQTMGSIQGDDSSDPTH